MRLVKYGVTLRRITENDLELLRNWRNSEQIKKFMHFREFITPEMQRKWFESVNNPDNYYYIIEYRENSIGLINEKNFDRTGTGTTESGIFIADENFSNSHVPVCASLILIEINLYWFNGKDSYIRILRDNYRSVNYNRQLGYVLCPGQEQVDNQLYVMTRKNFEIKTRKIIRAALRLSGGDSNLYIIMEKTDYNSGLAQAYENFFRNYPLKVDKKTDERGNTVFYYDMGIQDPVRPGKLDPGIEITPIIY